MESINTALIGHGYWGKNLLRNLIENPDTGDIYLCDSNSARATTVNYPTANITTFTNWEDVVTNKNIEAVVIATPTSTHYTIAKKCLAKGKHVLVEKPLCTSVREAEELCKLAEKNSLALMVDHIYLYNPIVRQLKGFLQRSDFGKMHYIDSTRINLGIYQKDTNVLWDLACHDISIINYLLEEKPASIRAIGKTNNFHSMEDIVYLFLNYASGILVHINTSWASPVKMRKMMLGGEKRMIIYDDIEPTNKLTIYDYDQNIPLDVGKSFLIDYRLGNITIPKCEIQEPLKNVVAEFYRCIKHTSQPLTNGHHATETVRILEAAQQSLNKDGALVML